MAAQALGSAGWDQRHQQGRAWPGIDLSTPRVHRAAEYACCVSPAGQRCSETREGAALFLSADKHRYVIGMLNIREFSR